MAAIKIESKLVVDEVSKALKILIKDSTQLQKHVDRSAALIGEELRQVILDKIEQEHPLGAWMANRTAIDIESGAKKLYLTIRGRQESEVASAKDPRTIAMNLWAVQEFGAEVSKWSSDGMGGKFIVFEKDGEWVVRRGRAGFNVTTNKGIIQNSILPSINNSIKQMSLFMAASIVVQKLQHDVPQLKLDNRALLKQANVSASWLKSRGLSLETTSAGQINIRGGSGRFQSHAGTNIPTRININSKTIKYS